MVGHRREDYILTSDEEAHRLVQMQRGICEFQCYCAALGSRRAALGHNVYAFVVPALHYDRFPCHLKGFAPHNHHWTVDFVMESNIPKFQPVPFSAAFPYFVYMDEHVPDDFGDALMSP